MIETKIATVKSDLIKFTEIMARENELPPFIVVGVLADILSDWKSKELVQVNDAYARRIKELNEEGEKDVQD